MKATGDRIELGDTLGHPQEPMERWGRIVGLRRDECPPRRSIIVRKFQNDDSWFPTGGYCTTWLVVPRGAAADRKAAP